jgi:hypothetical protein
MGTGASLDVDLRTHVAPIVAFILTASCGSGAKPTTAPDTAACSKPAGPTGSPVAGVSTCQVARQVTVRIAGDESIADAGPQPMAIIQFYKGKVPQPSWLVSAQLAAPVPIPARENETYRAGFQTAPGTYRGPGRYVLKLQNEEGKPALNAVDEVFLEIIRPSAPEKVIRYDRFVRPCDVRVGTLALEGTLDCPDIASTGGHHVSMTMRWRAA